MDLFDAEAMYDEDYLYFFASPGELAGEVAHFGDVNSDKATDLVWRLLDLRPDMAVLDLACGHGRIANRLAARGCNVTGLDSSAVFLERARADAAAAGVHPDYVAGDMRDLPWTAEFDRVVCWSTAFGYFDDGTNRRVLDQVARALRPGGRLALDLDNVVSFLGSYRPSRVTAEKDGDMLVDRYRIDPLTGRFEAERTVIRDGRARRLSFVKRLFAFPEIRGWLQAAGFDTVTAFGEDGHSLTAEHERMIVVADLPSGHDR